eukprot:CAMPEP_0168544926 /NCGR_PEP_ID=MMETSP0413-20121227/2684_1 /TAXON_ID=136452 /ORGANISM="Filamoeba nolandi, Strain NC-AS-23-1" /LENGTH=188 /DNA_ID=CAMNT_0008574987 /DNA_START=226 /DNA_END=789 /DNA_ORIENTATION=+
MAPTRTAISIMGHLLHVTKDGAQLATLLFSVKETLVKGIGQYPGKVCEKIIIPMLENDVWRPEFAELPVPEFLATGLDTGFWDRPIVINAFAKVIEKGEFDVVALGTAWFSYVQQMTKKLEVEKFLFSLLFKDEDSLLESLQAAGLDRKFTRSKVHKFYEAMQENNLEARTNAVRSLLEKPTLEPISK